MDVTLEISDTFVKLDARWLISFPESLFMHVSYAFPSLLIWGFCLGGHTHTHTDTDTDTHTHTQTHTHTHMKVSWQWMVRVHWLFHPKIGRMRIHKAGLLHNLLVVDAGYRSSMKCFSHHLPKVCVEHFLCENGAQLCSFFDSIELLQVWSFCQNAANKKLVQFQTCALVRTIDRALAINNIILSHHKWVQE